MDKKVSMLMEKVLLSIKEVCEYTGWGMTKTREILKRPESRFTVRVGNRLYVNKELFLSLIHISEPTRRS